MNRDKANARDTKSPDMTPMVDVTFLVLIFFMVTASFSMQKAIEMPAPKSDLASVQNEPQDQLPDPIRLVVDRHGAFFLLAVNFQKEIVGKQSLITELMAARSGPAGSGPAGSASVGNEIIRIEVDSDADLRSLVDAMDAAAIAGFSGIQLDEIRDGLI